MKILSAEQLRELDRYTIKHEPISSIKLMERASHKFYEQIQAEIQLRSEVYVFCGMGNNGGDGLNIADAIFRYKTEGLKVFVVEHSNKRSIEFEARQIGRKGKLKITYIKSTQQIPKIPETALVIDAIFGTGLTRKVEGIAADVISAINKSCATVYSVDIPSGLFADKLNAADDAIIQSTITYTFHSPKLSFMLPPNGIYVPDFKVLDIGLDKTYAAQMSSDYNFITGALVQSFFKQRQKFSHKGTYGHALIAAGSYGKMGAAVLAVKAASRSGAGLVSALIAKCGYEIMQTTNPEAMVSISGDNCLTDVPDLSAFDVVTVGPGIGTETNVYAFMSSLLKVYRKPMVLDADALNIIAEHSKFLKMIPEGSILTPHPGEFKRLAGEWKDDLDKLAKQLALAVKYKVVVVLKGAHTSVATPDGQIYFNSTGNAGMAKGGSGDVLTGIIVSLLAQNYTSTEAAILGVYVHGLAGDLAKEDLGETGMKAGDIIYYLPKAFKSLE